ncbi:MAG: hypothetical protein QOE00_834 [Ilumatobacteraceae bacterium]
MEVARQAGEQAGPQAGAAVKAAVDTAFIDGFRVGSWVSAGVVFVGALIAIRFLPRHAMVPDSAELALVAELEVTPAR